VVQYDTKGRERAQSLQIKVFHAAPPKLLAD
jgi:hypothetical protein